MNGPLDGVRVLDVSTLFAGPLAATFLGDFGADVVKVEHPRRPDASRGHGQAKDGVNLWWKTLGRNKRTLTLDLSTPEGGALLVDLARTADVLVENFRPGTLERWGLGPDVLLAANPALVLARVTAFGQTGPMANQPGFGSIAEAMSGFAAITGEPDGPPVLPPFGLADGITALATAYACAIALRHAERTGEGQVVDLAIIEPILMLLGGGITAYDQLGYRQPRTGNRSVNNAPRNVYRTADDRWVAVSTSSQSVAERVLRLVGRPGVVEQPWFASGRTRAEHVEELDEAVGSWIRARALEEVLAEFARVEAAVGVVEDVAGVMAHPQYAAIDTILEIDDEDLGPLRMQNVLFRMSRTPGRVRHTGRAHGQDTEEVLAGLGLTPEQVAGLRERGIV